MIMKKKNIMMTAAAAVAIVIGGAAFTTYQLLAPQFHPAQTAYVGIDNDDTTDSIVSKVELAGNPRSMLGFKLLLKSRGKNNPLPTGRYAINNGEKPIMLYRRMSQGRQAPVNLIVGSVRTTGMLARNLSRQLMADSAEIDRALHDSTMQHSLGDYNDSTIIALFLPDTYQVYWNITTDDLLHRMKSEHDTYWNEERRAMADSIGLSVNEVVTLASIVDEETNNAEEKPTVAGLYINRLHKGIPLQADPTVKFAMQDFGLRRISGEHLKFDSPYNTYQNIGLPPGPIRLPSKRGIESVLHYDHHDYIYMCAKEDFSGRHNFTASYAEHMRNAQRYRKALDERGIK
jgi:UPF0755 protein